MTAAIKSSLRDLHGAIEGLENTVVEAMAEKKNAEKSSQDDLFTLPLKGGAANDMDPKVLAGRLDSAIEKVEKLLREG